MTKLYIENNFLNFAREGEMYYDFKSILSSLLSLSECTTFWMQQNYAQHDFNTSGILNIKREKKKRLLTKAIYFQNVRSGFCFLSTSWMERPSNRTAAFWMIQVASILFFSLWRTNWEKRFEWDGGMTYSECDIVYVCVSFQWKDYLSSVKSMQLRFFLRFTLSCSFIAGYKIFSDLTLNWKF